MKKAIIQKGFTLVEVAIVMALLTITASFAIPAWQNFAINTNLKTATRELMADVLNATHLAIANNSNSYCITLNVNANSYSLLRTDTDPDQTLWTKSIESFGHGNYIESVDFGGGSNIGFQKRGTINPVFGTIILKNKIGSKATISVQLTGRAYAQYDLQK